MNVTASYRLVSKEKNNGYVIVIEHRDDFNRLLHYEFIDETPVKKGSTSHVIYEKLRNNEKLFHRYKLFNFV